MSAAYALHAFVERINAHDVDGLVALMTDDHVLVDAVGDALTGLGELEQAWHGYLASFPDYRIEVERVLEDAETAVALGIASGTYARNGAGWRVPAAWAATVRGGRIAAWRVFSDTKTVYDVVGDG